MDADLSHHVEKIQELVTPNDYFGTKFVLGSRYLEYNINYIKGCWELQWIKICKVYSDRIEMVFSYFWKKKNSISIEE